MLNTQTLLIAMSTKPPQKRVIIDTKRHKILFRDLNSKFIEHSEWPGSEKSHDGGGQQSASKTVIEDDMEIVLVKTNDTEKQAADWLSQFNTVNAGNAHADAIWLPSNEYFRLMSSEAKILFTPAQKERIETFAPPESKGNMLSARTLGFLTLLAVGGTYAFTRYQANKNTPTVESPPEKAQEEKEEEEKAKEEEEAEEGKEEEKNAKEGASPEE